ncbi:MAG: hypothetical protein WC514_02915 [Candidatus Paceibacterota bacterium]
MESVNNRIPLDRGAFIYTVGKLGGGEGGVNGGFGAGGGVWAGGVETGGFGRLYEGVWE